MKNDVRITVRDFPHSEALDTRIREKVAKLEKMFPRLVSSHVVMAAPHHHQHNRALFNVHITATFPGGEIAVQREDGDDVHVLLRDAFAAARRELEKAMRRDDGGAKLHAHRLAGPPASCAGDENE